MLRGEPHAEGALHQVSEFGLGMNLEKLFVYCTSSPGNASGGRR